MNAYTLVAYLQDLARNARTNIAFCKEQVPPNADKGWMKLQKEFERQERVLKHLIEVVKRASARDD